MQVNTSAEDNYYRIALDGELDASSAIAFDAVLQEAVETGHHHLLIDCQRLTYISSAGLGVFMSHVQEFEEKKIQMIIFGLTTKVLNVFQILGLDQLLHITATEPEAKAQLNALHL
jgi:anti-sigma B factor antagonist